MVANGLTSTPLRRSYEIFGQMGDISDRQSLTIGNTFEGQLPGNFHWEAFWQYGRSTNDISAYNATRASRFIAARDVISDPVTGEPVCRDPVARAAGCVPFNIFSFDPLTQEQRDYMLATRRKHRENTQTVYGGNIKGNLFSLPAGELQAVFGVEHRRETVDNVDGNLAAPPDSELSHLGNWAPYEPALRAANDVSEAYAELVVPILKDLPFAQRLTVEGAYRYSDYSDFDKTNTWKLGGNWMPIEGLTFRAVKSRSVRVPNFGELYASRALQAIGLTDPCMGTNYNANPTRAANCAALGISAPLPNQIYTGYVISGGNPDVNPETSDSSSVGVVWQPRFLRGFDLTLDYWHINIENIITALSRTDIPNLCVDLPSIDNEFCGRTTRDENQVAGCGRHQRHQCLGVGRAWRRYRRELPLQPRPGQLEPRAARQLLDGIRNHDAAGRVLERDSLRRRLSESAFQGSRCSRATRSATGTSAWTRASGAARSCIRTRRPTRNTTTTTSARRSITISPSAGG